MTCDGQVRGSGDVTRTLFLKAICDFIGALVAAVALLTLSAEAATLDDIKKRGVLTCGVSEGVPGFSAEISEGVWAGLDVDFCKALAAAVLADPTKIKLVPTSSEDRFKRLTEGSVDVLTRNTSWTMQREIEQGVIFPAVLYFDGQGFLVPRELGLSNPNQLAGAKICVLSGTTSETNAVAYFAKAGRDVEFVKFKHRKEAIEAYEAGACDARSADRTALFGEMQLLAEPSRHMVLAETISKEPLGPVVRAGDRAWADVVRWVMASLINAEDVQLTQNLLPVQTAPKLSLEQGRLVEDAGKLGTGLGLSSTWVADVVRAVGNYAEMFDRNVGKTSALGMVRGANALWKNGGLMYAPPMP